MFRAQWALTTTFTLLSIAVIAQGAEPKRGGAPAAILPSLQPKPKPLAAGRQTPPKKPEVAAEMTVDKLTAMVRDSTVVVSVIGRDGERSGLGSGFVIAKGLIATNMHVIGEARRITVTTATGKRLEVSEVHATDRAMDLAVLRIAADELKPLEIGDSESLRQGQDVAAIGNPRGLEYSVVTGVVSGFRTIDGKPMIQLAMPIEQGNSGGPLLDRRGRVQGILTMKSVVTDNLGFALAINSIKPLLKKPNPVPIDRWLTIGALDPSEWTPFLGGHWRQRAGRIVVEGPGTGFGGRTLLVSKRHVPAKGPYEIAVWVRLKHEDGAAGLMFQFHDGDRHYGFYSSNGRMRFTRFDGPDVYAWQVLSEVRSKAYRPGDWNRLKIRLEPGKITGYVNEVLVVESTDDQFAEGAAGLASFRETQAEFKGFEIGKNLASSLPSRELIERVDRTVAGLNVEDPVDSKTIDLFLPDRSAGVTALRERADRREREARQLRSLASAIEQRQIQRDLDAVFKGKAEKDIDLLRAALLVARADNAEIDVEAYQREVEQMAASVRADLPKNADTQTKLRAIDDTLFKKLGFHGSRTDFYNRSNSYLNEVIDDREGLPITLAVLYIEMARRVGVSVSGVGSPGRFLVRVEGAPASWAFIDVFDNAKRLSQKEAEALAASMAGRAITEDDLRLQTKKQIVQRLVSNLVNIAQDANDSEGMLRYVELLLILDPDSLGERWRRAVLCYQTGRRTESLAETNWLLAKEPNKLADVADPVQVRQLKALLESLH